LGGCGGVFGGLAFGFDTQFGGQRGEFCTFGCELVGVFERAEAGGV
jgi:hypothetical protein